MPELRELPESSTCEQELTRISAALHDLCQPLTTLQCRLEMAELLDTPESYREAVVAGMRECLRLSAAVTSMRVAVGAAMQQAGGGDREPAQFGATG
jgi:hypothetical protein